MPSGLCDRVQRVLPLVERVADEIVTDETKVLKELIPRMFEVMYRVARLSCDYVTRGRLSSPWFDKLLTIRSEKDRWSRVPGDDRRNGQRVNRGGRRLRPCYEFRGSPPGY